jgi:hypothetical protein
MHMLHLERSDRSSAAGLGVDTLAAALLPES